MSTVTYNPTQEQIVALREKTGAGIMACKKALTESQGDVEKAVESLRKKGLADLAKRTGRTTKEGLLTVKMPVDGKKAALLELNCETDFVAKTPDFRKLGDEFAEAILNDLSLKEPEKDPGLIERMQQFAMKVGENMQLRRGLRFELAGPGALNYYVHTDSKKAALVEILYEGDAAAAGEDLKNLAKEIALQAVAMSPRWVRKEEVPAEVIEKEKEIYRATAENQGKPAAAIDKMLPGKLNKFFQENCVLDQASIRDSKMTVAELVSQTEKKIGGKIKVTRFVRWQLGEEI